MSRVDDSKIRNEIYVGICYLLFVELLVSLVKLSPNIISRLLSAGDGEEFIPVTVTDKRQVADWSSSMEYCQRASPGVKIYKL